MQLGLRGWTLKCSAPPPPSAQGVKDVAQMLMGGRQVTVVNCVKEDDGPGHKSIKQVGRRHTVLSGSAPAPALFFV